MEFNGLCGAPIRMNGLRASRARLDAGTPIRDVQTSAGLNALQMLSDVADDGESAKIT